MYIFTLTQPTHYLNAVARTHAYKFNPLIVTIPYHWRKLPQVLFSSLQTRVCRDKTRVCRGKSTKVLPRQNIFVATNTFLSRQKFCRDKHTFVAAKDVFCRDKSKLVATFVATKSRLLLQIFIATTVLSRQNYVCRDKRRVL